LFRLPGGMVTLLRDHVALTRQTPMLALAAASHPPGVRIYPTAFFRLTAAWAALPLTTRLIAFR